jgi:hypothetical protein
MIKRGLTYYLIISVLFSLFSLPALAQFKTGSCRNIAGGNYCGGSSPDNCYCDEACTSYKDCCKDYAEVCKKADECTNDSDCPQVPCIPSQCPVNRCIDGKCVLKYDNPTCGNGKCEQGEADECPSCVYSNPPCEAPCKVGTCPKDCNQNKCTDSDGGIDYYVKGETAVCPTTGNGVCTAAADSCSGNYLNEFYCNGNSISSLTYNCLNGCLDGACKQTSIIVGEVETDKKFYGLGENVIIAATISYTGSYADSIKAIIYLPNYKESTIQMKASACSANPSGQTKCTYKGEFNDTYAEGTYSVLISAENSSYEKGFAIFSVLDKTAAEKYLILSDIGQYKLVIVQHSFDNSLGIDVYNAYYSTDTLSNNVAMYVFGSRNALFKFLNDALTEVNYYTTTIGGNLVYVVSEGNSQIIVWTEKNLLIVSYPGQSYYVPYASDVAYSPESKNAQSITPIKTASIAGIFGNAVASQTKAETTTIPSYSYNEVVSAYLKKHPSDLDTLPPQPKITKKDVLIWIDQNCNDNVIYPQDDESVSEDAGSLGATGNVIRTQAEKSESHAYNIQKIFYDEKEYWKD